MSKWQQVKLGDIACNIQTGPFGSQLHQSDYSETGTPVVMPKDLVEGKISEQSIARVEASHIERLAKHKIQNGDILYSRRGDVGRCAYAGKKETGWLCGTGCLRVTIDESHALPKFIFYQLQTSQSVGWVEKHAVGSTMLNLNTSILSNIPILLPPIEVQRKIADVLSAYDDLIENNRKQIKLLEEAAQRLYKEWFIDLRFPGHESTPIVNGIPADWERKKLEKICPILTGKRDANFGSPEGKYLFFTCAQEPIKSATFSFDTSAVILAGNGDFNVKLYRGKFEAYQRTYVLSPQNSEMLFLLFGSVRTNMCDLTQKASGSTIKFLTRGMIANIEILVPDDNLLKQYNNFSNNIQKKIEYLSDSIKYVTETRNRLLPKLMSGELEVANEI